MTDHELRARGIQAQNLMKDEMLQEAIREVAFAAHRAFESAHGDVELVRQASHLLDAANRFQLVLRLAMEQGKAADKRLDREIQGGRARRAMREARVLVRNRNAPVEGMPWRSVG
jgi:hypothetical protein